MSNALVVIADWDLALAGAELISFWTWIHLRLVSRALYRRFRQGAVSAFAQRVRTRIAHYIALAAPLLHGALSDDRVLFAGALVAQCAVGVHRPVSGVYLHVVLPHDALPITYRCRQSLTFGPQRPTGAINISRILAIFEGTWVPPAADWMVKVTVARYRGLRAALVFDMRRTDEWALAHGRVVRMRHWKDQ